MFDSINWSRFIDPIYWLEGIISEPGAALVTPVIDSGSKFYWFFLILFTVFVNAAIFLKIINIFLNEEHPLKSKIPFYSDNLIWMGILGFAWFISRQLSLAFIGARIWLIVGLVWFGIISFYKLRYLIKFFPLELRYYKQNLASKIKVANTKK